MQMRQSRVLKKLRAGQVASCIKINLSDPRVIEIAAMCGFDCVWLDMEHVPTDWQTVENQIRAAKIYDCDTMVRVAQVALYSSHIQPLEADASGIMVPHLMSLEDAKKSRLADAIPSARSPTRRWRQCRWHLLSCRFQRIYKDCQRTAICSCSDRRPRAAE